MAKYFSQMALAASVIGLSAVSAHAATITFSLVANATTNTWAAYGWVDNSTGTASNGLCGFSITVAGSNGLAVASSAEAALSYYVGGSGKIGATGFSDVSDGTNGVNIQGAQAFGTNKNYVKSGMHNIYYGYALTTGTADDGSGNSWGSTPGEPAGAALLATGTFTGSSGTLTVSGTTAGITLLPTKATAANATSTGQTFTTFSPSATTSGTWTLTSGPTHTNYLMLLLESSVAGLSTTAGGDTLINNFSTGSSTDTAFATVINAFAAETSLSSMTLPNVLQLHMPNPSTSKTEVVLLWGNFRTALSLANVPGASNVYTPSSAPPEIDTAWLKAAYGDGWSEMLVYSSQGTGDQYLGLNLTGTSDTITGVALVPEPATAGLLALGALGLLGRKRK